MCLGIPGQIVKFPTERPDVAIVDVQGVSRPINVGLLIDDELHPGQWILVHMGFALETISAAQAKAALAFMQADQNYIDALITGNPTTA